MTYICSRRRRRFCPRHKIENLISRKTGYRPVIRFNDPIRISYDGDKALAHLNLDI